MIALEDVSVAFGGTLALDSVNLTLQTGITGLFGPNGSGKSTLLRAIAALIKPTRGRVLWDGVPASLSSETARAAVGFAGHESGLYPHLSIVENLELFAHLYGAGDARPVTVMDELGLADHSNVSVAELPAGYKRRAAVARALLHEPKILLLDEPFANVDDDAADLITEAIRRWARPGRAGVVATHGAKRVKPFADATLVLRRGSVAAFRTAAETS